MVMYGWTGKILHIDLTLQKAEPEMVEPAFYHQLIGGRGMGGHYLRACATMVWNDPGMVIAFFTGPLVGTAAPTSGRGHWVTKSPLTGLVGDASTGGKLATQLKRAGWDGLVISGRSAKPVGLVIRDNQIVFQDAADLWGMETGTVYTAIDPQNAALACIGPAAENGVRFASLVVDQYHSAGRTGIGLSLAVKQLKYILVEGNGQVRVKDPEALERARQDILRLTAASPALMGQFGFTHLGTGALYDLLDNRRMMPTENFRKTWFEPARGLNAAAYDRAYAPEQYGCPGCPILCKKISKQSGKTFVLPEYETMSHFTALICCTDIQTVVAADGRCRRYGMDPVSAAVTLACRQEITAECCSGDQVLALLDDMASGRGEGAVLARGAAGYAQAMGHPECAMTVKGLELPAYDPRGAYGLALAYAVATRGGCHLRAYPLTHEIFRKPVATDRFSFSGKARIIKLAEDFNAVVDSLTACRFMFIAAGLEDYARVFTAVTGVTVTAQDLLVSGERIDYNERMINALNGFDRQHDDLPGRFFSEPGSSGHQIAIAPINRNDFLTARAKYYRIRGLDEQGRPTRQKAHKLELPWIDW